jgi:hypothetical protein
MSDRSGHGLTQLPRSLDASVKTTITTFRAAQLEEERGHLFSPFRIAELYNVAFKVLYPTSPSAA